MSVVADTILCERVERYLTHNPEATLPEVLCRFLIDPDEARSDERALVEGILAAHSDDEEGESTDVLCSTVDGRTEGGYA